MVINSLRFFITVAVVYSQFAVSHSCGVPRVSVNQLIVNGRDTVLGQWPWHAALYHREKTSDKYWCGATLINAWFVITAAHCTENPDNRHQLPSGNFFIRLGIHNLRRLSKLSLQEHGIDKIFTPDSFNSLKQLKNDIALLRLSTKANFDQYVQPACLNTRNNLVDQYGTAVGWGWTESNSLSTVLKSSRMPVIKDVVCLASNRDAFGSFLDEGVFCAGYRNGTSVCNGDSGGGLFFQQGGAWYLGGVISFSTPHEQDELLCDSKGYGAFTKVSKYMQWIRHVAGPELTADSVTSFSDAPNHDFTNRVDVSNNEPVSANAPINAVWTSSGPHREHVEYTDENGGIVKQWKTHYTDPHTGQVTTASGSSYSHSLSNSDNGNGPRFPTVIQNSFSNSGGIDAPNHDFTNRVAVSDNEPVSAYAPINAVWTSSGPHQEHVKYMDENGGIVEQWRSHNVHTDPHTGQVRTASSHKYSYSRSNSDNGNGPRFPTFNQHSFQNSGGIDMSNAMFSSNSYNHRQSYSYHSSGRR